MPRHHRPYWQFSAREARVHALLVACVLWTGAVVLMLSGSGYRDALGHLKGTDFVHFYTLGHVAIHGPASDLLDADKLHARQVALVPESAAEGYLATYPPHMALVFAPLSHLPYGIAAGVFALTNVALYVATLWLAWRLAGPATLDARLLVACAAAFPPFWNLVLHGQSTFAPIIAFNLGAYALIREHRMLAGAACGLLLLKPQFGLMLAVVVLASREWKMLAGAVISVVAQVVLAGVVFGGPIVAGYVDLLRRLPAMQSALEPLPQQLHSIAALTSLLPAPVDVVVWLIASGWVALLTVRIWRSELPRPTRMAALVMGSVLVNPHVNVYDLTVVAVPLVWVAGWLETSTSRWQELRQRWWTAVYLWFALLLLPTAYVIAVQGSVLILVWLVYVLANAATRMQGGARVEVRETAVAVP